MQNEDQPWYDRSLPKMGSIGFVVAAYLYLIGWSYCYWFLKYFGISINAVSIQFYHIFVYSVGAIFSLRTVTTVLGFMFCAIFLFVILIAFVRFKFKQPILALLLISLIPLSFQVAKQEGRLRAIQIQTGACNPIVVVLKTTVDSEFSEEFMKANENKELRLVTMTQDRLYVYRQLGGKSGKLPGFVYEIPRAEVFLARILVNPPQ